MTAVGTDFNDLATAKGLSEVRRQLAPVLTSPPAAPDFDAGPSPLAPPTMRSAGFPAFLRDIVAAACASSEAHPVAVAANCIAFYSAMIGRGAFQRIGDACIHARPFMLIIGKSGKARKGTAEHTPREVFRRADAVLRERLKTADRLRIHAGGLSTGEGIAFAIRDPREADEKGKGGDVGVHDKRLVVIEPEFANVLAQVMRDGNTLSAVLRNLFDGRDIEPMTKTSQTKATRPHVCVLGHITGFELKEKSTENDAANGLLNRFMMLHVHRPKLVPLPEPTPDDVLDALAERVADAVEHATAGQYHTNNARAVAMGDEARDFWVSNYPDITRDRDGRTGNLLARSEVYARMLAMVFCLMDMREEIEPCDLDAALAWIEYWHDSVSYVFRAAEEERDLDPFAAEVLALIASRPNISLSEIQEHWHRNKTKAVKAALERLLSMAPPLIEAHRDAGTGGRAAIRYRTPA